MRALPVVILTSKVAEGDDTQSTRGGSDSAQQRADEEAYDGKEHDQGATECGDPSP